MARPYVMPLYARNRVAINHDFGAASIGPRHENGWSSRTMYRIYARAAAGQQQIRPRGGVKEASTKWHDDCTVICRESLSDNPLTTIEQLCQVGRRHIVIDVYGTHDIHRSLCIVCMYLCISRYSYSCWPITVITSQKVRSIATYIICIIP